MPIDIEPVPDQVGETPSLNTEALLPARAFKPFQDSLRIATSNRFVDLFKKEVPLPGFASSLSNGMVSPK